MSKLDIKPLNSSNVKDFVGRTEVANIIHKENTYNTYKEYFRKNGKAFVPIQPNQSVISRNRKKRFMGERKLYDWEIFHRALLAEPMIFRSLILKARYITAYGYKYTYNRRRMLNLNKNEDDILDFFYDWDEYISMTSKLFSIYVCCSLYGNAFIEKVYDERGYNGGGWGIKDLKVIHPVSMYVERGDRGEIIRYWQKPPNYHGKNLETIRKMGGMPIPPNRIVHFKWNDFVNKTYGMSDLRPLIDTISMKVGMREDASIMVQQRANPIITWYVGDLDHPVASKVVSAISQYIAVVADGSNDVVLPGFVKGDVLSTGDKMPNINDYISMFSSEIVKGIGVPEVLLGEGNETTEATASVQMESFYGEIRYIQNAFSDKLRREVFVDIINPPTRNRSDRIGSDDNIEIDRKLFRKLPSIKFDPILSALDKINSAIKLYKEGILSIDEARAMIKYFDELNMERINPEYRLVEEQIISEGRKLDIEEKKIESQEKIAEKNAQRAQNQNNGNGNEKDENSRKTNSFPFEG